jgi:hypothetical protein
MYRNQLRGWGFAHLSNSVDAKGQNVIKGTTETTEV